ncbi:hypothetical protein FKM82_014182 [Ascaphus truei]
MASANGFSVIVKEQLSFHMHDLQELDQDTPHLLLPTTVRKSNRPSFPIMKLWYSSWPFTKCPPPEAVAAVGVILNLSYTT